MLKSGGIGIFLGNDIVIDPVELWFPLNADASRGMVSLILLSAPLVRAPYNSPSF